MPYTKTNWVDRVVQNPLTFTQRNNGDGTITLVPSEGTIIQAGTPINASIMNNLETQYDRAKEDLDTLTMVAQMTKITNDTGGVTISASTTNDDMLAMIASKGTGMNTVYAVRGSKNMPPTNLSIRGISFFTSANFGFVWVTDYNNQLFTNYMDNGVWLGWLPILNGAPPSWTNLSLLNGATVYATGSDPQYTKLGNVVYIQGAVKGLTGSNTIVGVLPVGYRPVTQVAFANPTTNLNGANFARWVVNPNGEIKIESISSGGSTATNAWYPMTMSFVVA